MTERSVRRIGIYAYDQDWQEERKRLAGMEALWDPGTKAVISNVGIRAGWRCLEVGAGGGSIAEWMAEAVGPGGHVVATDVSTRYLEPIAAANLEVLEHNILTDPLPKPGFDLVHARLVAEHLGRESVERMVAALAPGGWLVLEDFDMSGYAGHPPSEAGDRALDAVLTLMQANGFDPYLGRKLVHELESLGLARVAAEGRSRVYRGGSPGAAFSRLSLESLRPTLVEGGHLSEKDAEAALAAIDDPQTVFVSPTMVAAWGWGTGRSRAAS